LLYLSAVWLVGPPEQATTSRQRRISRVPRLLRQSGANPLWPPMLASAGVALIVALRHYLCLNDRSPWPPGSSGNGAGGAKITAVVLRPGVVLAFADVRVGVDVRGVLDLIHGHGQYDQLLAVQPESVDRCESLPGAHQARVSTRTTVAARSGRRGTPW
jgi:hypothetical protein